MPFSKKLPSVSELLESPTLKTLVDHIHPSTLMSTAKKVLDEVTAEAQHAAAERSLPSVGELVERIARHVIYGEDAVKTLCPVLNGTGCFLHPLLGPPPLAFVAVEAIQASSHAYLVESDTLSGGAATLGKWDKGTTHPERPSSSARQLLQQIEQALHNMTGAEAAWICCDEGPAVYAICKSLCTGFGSGGLIVARMDMVRRNRECCLPDLIRETTGHWEEVGTAESVTVDDYRAAIEDDDAFKDADYPGVLFYAEPDNGNDGVTQRASIAELASLSHENDMMLICELGAASLVDLKEHGIEGVPNAKQAITAGADLVIMNVELLGVPRCAIVLGRKELLGKIRHRNTTKQLAPTPGESTLAALASVLAHCQSPEAMVLTVPILELLSVSSENLKNRAERLSPQLAILAGIKAAEPVEATVRFRAEIPTWKIAVEPETLSASELATKLAQAEPGILVGVQDAQITIDLRTIFARQDVEIVGIFEKVLEVDEEEV